MNAELRKILNEIDFHQTFEIASKEPQLKSIPVHYPEIFKIRALNSSFCLPDTGSELRNSAFHAYKYKATSKIKFSFLRQNTLHIYSPYMFQLTKQTKNTAQEYFDIPRRPKFSSQLRTIQKDWSIDTIAQQEVKNSFISLIQAQNPKFKKLQPWGQSSLRLIGEQGLSGHHFSNHQGLVFNVARNFSSCTLRCVRDRFNFELNEEYLSVKAASNIYDCTLSEGALKYLELVETLIAKEWSVQERIEWFPANVVLQVKPEKGIVAILSSDQINLVPNMKVDYFIIEYQ